MKYETVNPKQFTEGFFRAYELFLRTGKMIIPRRWISREELEEMYPEQNEVPWISKVKDATQL